MSIGLGFSGATRKCTGWICVVAVVDPSTDGTLLSFVQGTHEPRVATECCKSVVSPAGEFALRDNGRNGDRECDIVRRDDRYLARSRLGSLLDRVRRGIGEFVRGVVGRTDVVCQLRVLKAVLP